MLNTGDIHKHFIRLHFSFQQAVNPTIEVQPGKTPFNLPALVAIFLLPLFFRRQVWRVVVARSKDWHDIPFSAHCS